MNRDELTKLLPHRPPMLLLDEAELLPDGTARGIYRVRGDEWFLQGHFPDNPVVPGVILCEMMAQTCCVLIGGQGEPSTPYFTGLENVRFRQKVYPGDEIVFICAITRQKGPFYFAQGNGCVKDAVAVNGSFSFKLDRGAAPEASRPKE